eukprot:4521225-Pyramimonas_sp.AAC.1
MSGPPSGLAAPHGGAADAAFSASGLKHPGKMVAATDPMGATILTLRSLGWVGIEPDRWKDPDDFKPAPAGDTT